MLRRIAHWLMKEPALEEEALRARIAGGRLLVERRSTEAASPPDVSVLSPGGVASRAPLRERATAVLRACFRLARGRLALVGVGGIASGADAYARIRAGADLVQLYTGFAYAGPALVPRIKRELAALLRRIGDDGPAAALDVAADHAPDAPAVQARAAAGRSGAQPPSASSPVPPRRWPGASGGSNPASRPRSARRRPTDSRSAGAPRSTARPAQAGSTSTGTGDALISFPAREPRNTRASGPVADEPRASSSSPSSLISEIALRRYRS